ncbi:MULTISPECIES: hypothetical protein [unclassified Exiguobacterium]|uniref:hypothetical protein n=1 Tax=unclassified Exiguobacterium TaxID=2644629 RepID=UPI00103A3867|nr:MULTISPECIES: hypothetical protein [unclassified Exiguobacterium]TCI69643.1 hypothetical protein EVJ19_08435 [Exiguobacterium sp. IPCI3]TCI78940.1 hypothetical protein EVJ18_08435 [Exiguobacterium sp. IPCH1]TCI81527.1 hypothetical protein EVJ17_08435 [Exiguobacterium sp. IPBC4]
MHQIQVENESVSYRVTIVEADRAFLILDVHGRREVVTTANYISFARDLTTAHRRLSGVAQLLNVQGEEVLNIEYLGGHVDVQLIGDAGIRTLTTDQSYMTPVLAQIGIVE